MTNLHTFQNVAKTLPLERQFSPRRRWMLLAHLSLAGTSLEEVSSALSTEGCVCRQSRTNKRTVLANPYARAWVRLSVGSTMVRQTDKPPTQKRDKSGPGR